jgi:hypothetical protein
MAAMDGAWLVHVAAHGTFRADSRCSPRSSSTTGR